MRDGVARPGQPGLAPVIRPSLSAFERWLGGRRVSTVRIPPTLRTATGGAKRVEVPGRDGPRGRDGARRAAPGPRGPAARPGRRPEPRSSTRSSTTPTSATSQGLDTPVGDGTRWCCCRRWPAARGRSAGRDSRGRAARPRRAPWPGRRRGRPASSMPTDSRTSAGVDLERRARPPTCGSSPPGARSAIRRRRATRPG